MKTRREWIALLLFLAACFAAGAIGVPFTTRAVADWYGEIRKPSWTPPNWLFGPAWTTLYAMMGIAAWLVWRRGGFKQHRAAMVLFFIQLALNAAWTPVFFGARAFGAAFILLAAMWGFILATLVAFRRANVLASVLLVPYLLWVGYAGTLNFAVWWMNR